MRYCKLCGAELIDKQIYYCSTCKKKKQVEWTMKCRKCHTTKHLTRNSKGQFTRAK